MIRPKESLNGTKGRGSPPSFESRPEESRPGNKPRQPLPLGMEPMLGIDDLAALLRCSRRLIERMRSAGKVPPPDLRVGRMPRWRAETIRQWIGGGAHV